MRRLHWLLLLLPLLCLFVSNYYSGLVGQYAILGATAALLAFSWGYAGVLHFFHVVAFGLGAYSVGWFALNLGPDGLWLGLLVAVLLTGGVAFLLGIAGLGKNYSFMTFALVTFVVVLALEQIAVQFTAVTGGFNGLSNIPRLGFGDWRLSGSMNALVLATVAVLLVIGLRWLSTTPYGVALRAVRDAPRRMGSFGVDVPAMRISVFVLTSAATGLLGGLFATQTQFVSPSDIGLAFGTSILVWTMLGSKTTLLGPFLAAIGINFATTGLSESLVDYWLLIMGVVFVVVVRFLPEGFGVWLVRILPSRWRRAPHVEVRRAAPEAPRDAAVGGAAPEFVVEQLSVAYGSNRVLQDVGLHVSPGEVLCLIGPNGAGKSTVLNALSAVIRVESGRWRFGDRQFQGRSPWRIARDGLSRKYQHPSIATDLTVGQNLALAVWGPRYRFRRLLWQRWEIEIEPSAWRILEAGGLDARLDQLAAELSHGQRQMLELAMALANPCDVLLLDEPAAGMTKVEAATLASLITEIARDARPAVIVVEHDLELIRTVADRVVVLQNGGVLAEGTYAEVEADVRVQEAYLGTEAQHG